MSITEDRERWGQEVRAEWVDYAHEQPDITEHPHWLTLWPELPERDKEVDRRIGERLYRLGYTAGIRTAEARMANMWALRPVVLAFALQIEEALRRKDALGYGTWREESLEDLLHHVIQEAKEVYDAMQEAHEAAARTAPSHTNLLMAMKHVLREAADVALCAMMLADTVTRLCEHDGRGRAKEFLLPLLPSLREGGTDADPASHPAKPE